MLSIVKYFEINDRIRSKFVNIKIRGYVIRDLIDDIGFYNWKI